MEKKTILIATFLRVFFVFTFFDLSFLMINSSRNGSNCYAHTAQFFYDFFLLTDKPLVIAGKQSISTIWLLDGFRKIAGMNLKFRKWYYSELNEIFKKASPRHLFNYKPLVKYVFIKNSEYKMGKWDP